MKERKKSPWMHWMNLQFENLPLLSYSYTLRCVVVSHARDTRESSSSLWENVCAMCAGVAFLVVACLLLHPASQWERNWMRYLLVNLYKRAKKHRLSTYSQMKKKKTREKKIILLHEEKRRNVYDSVRCEEFVFWYFFSSFFSFSFCSLPLSDILEFIICR